jgi:hypothetical protein
MFWMRGVGMSGRVSGSVWIGVARDAPKISVGWTDGEGDRCSRGRGQKNDEIEARIVGGAMVMSSVGWR